MLYIFLFVAIRHVCSRHSPAQLEGGSEYRSSYPQEELQSQGVLVGKAA